MATTTASAYNIVVNPDNTGLLSFTETEVAARKVTDLLQKDMKNHHVFFNDSNLHNHIPHHLLALYGTGSNEQALQKAYDENATYQRTVSQPDSAVVNALSANWIENSPKYLGQGKHYPDFLKYFQDQIQKSGWEAVIMDHLFAENPAGRDMTCRLFAGILHPMIQLMYGIEWQQPAIIAEGLAQTAVHKNRISVKLDRMEKHAVDEARDDLTIPALLEGVPGRSELSGQRRYVGLGESSDDSEQIKEAIKYVSQVGGVASGDLDEKAAEMIHTLSWMVLATGRDLTKVPQFSFYFIHHLNAAPFLLTMLKQPWLDQTNKARLLAFKIRYDALVYISLAAPKLDTQAIKDYVPQSVRDGEEKELVKDPMDLLPRFHDISDDGHLIKVARSLMIAREVSRAYRAKSWIRMEDDDMWVRGMYMILDSAKNKDTPWHF